MINPCTSFSFDNASFKVSITNLLSLYLDILYETTCLSYKSIIVDRYALAPLNIKYVTSVSHTLFGALVVKFLFNRFGLTLVMDTLNEALSKEKDVHGLIIHSDQGFQYTSYEYKAICESNGIQISMSRKGTPIDDSPIESWHSLLKKETLYNNNITSLQEYIQLVEDWILFYNTTRLKSKVKKKRKNYTKREK